MKYKYFAMPLRIGENGAYTSITPPISQHDACVGYPHRADINLFHTAHVNHAPKWFLEKHFDFILG